MTQERRRFTRIHFDAKAEINYNGQVFAVHLIDLSLKGALVNTPQVLPCQPNDSITLNVHLSCDSISLKFPSQLTHIEGNHIGLRFGVIDLDTLTHLRRLVELNIGNSDLLERELEQLFNQHN